MQLVQGDTGRLFDQKGFTPSLSDVKDNYPSPCVSSGHNRQWHSPGFIPDHLAHPHTGAVTLIRSCHTESSRCLQPIKQTVQPKQLNKLKQ